MNLLEGTLTVRRFSSRAALAFLLPSLLAGASLPRGALAQPKPEDNHAAEVAVTLSKEAKAAFDSGDFSTALALYQRADKGFHTIKLTIGAARSMVRLKRLVAARDLYAQIVREGPPDVPSPEVRKSFEKTIDEAKAELADLEKNVPTITVSVAGAQDPEVRVNGEKWPVAELGKKRPVDPGTYRIQFVATPKFAATEQTVNAVEGSSLVVTLTPEPVVVSAGDKDNDGIKDGLDACPEVAGVSSADPKLNGCPAARDTDGDGILDPSDACPNESGAPNADPKKNGCPSSQTSPPSANPLPPTPPSSGGSKGLTYTAFAVGIVGVGVGTGVGIYSLTKASDLKDSCPNNSCPASKKSDLDSYGTIKTVSTTGFIVGGVGIALGTVLLLTSGSPSSTPKSGALQPFLAPGSAGVLGQF